MAQRRGRSRSRCLERSSGRRCGLSPHTRPIRTTPLKAGKKLASGHVVGAAKTFFGSGGSSATATTGSRAATLIGLAAIGAWVLGGAKFTMHETAKVLTQTTTPQLRSTWFSSTYWRMAAIASVLTLPFLFAAAVQALMRSELSLLPLAAFGYLPLAMLCVGIAAPVTTL